ncbi:MAG: sugar transferase [Armatimonadetes bacterium]|nr:sugar transferase [Armatimonadota bacterium]
MFAPLDALLKRTVDIVGAAFALVLFAPLFVLLAVWIRLDSKGKALFRQPRLGKHGRQFTFLKFRTMVVDAPDIRNEDGSTFNAEDDPRVTRAGRFLRKTSLDELPQFWNVLMGSMSLVGPRPDLVSQMEQYDANERAKLNVKPGITGLAQINGRNTISWVRRKELDVQYSRSHNVLFDMAIMAKTVVYVLSRRGVYAESSQGASQ